MHLHSALPEPTSLNLSASQQSLARVVMGRSVRGAGRYAVRGQRPLGVGQPGVGTHLGEALVGRVKVADTVVEHRQQRSPSACTVLIAYSLPLVEGSTSPSTLTASRRERAAPLNMASIMWWVFLPRRPTMCRVTPAEVTNARQNSSTRCGSKLIAGRVDDHEHQLAARGEFAVDGGASLSLAGARRQTGHPSLDRQRVTGHHLAPEARPVEPPEEGESALVSAIGQNRQRSHLCNRLTDEHSGERWAAWKMTREEGLVASEPPDTDRRLARDDGTDVVYEKERRSVRQHLDRIRQAHCCSTSCGATAGPQCRGFSSCLRP